MSSQYADLRKYLDAQPAAIVAAAVQVATSSTASLGEAVCAIRIAMGLDDEPQVVTETRDPRDRPCPHGVLGGIDCFECNPDQGVLALSLPPALAAHLNEQPNKVTRRYTRGYTYAIEVLGSGVVRLDTAPNGDALLTWDPALVKLGSATYPPE